jgi:hypothetical protein
MRFHIGINCEATLPNITPLHNMNRHPGRTVTTLSGHGQHLATERQASLTQTPATSTQSPLINEFLL